MDDEQLAAAFRDAAAGGPPPGFDHGDVVRAADRLRARRRAVLATTAVAAAVLVGGGGVAGAIALRSDATTTSAAGAPAAAPADSAGEGAAPRPEAARGGAVPLGPGHGTCANRQDPALRALVVQVLPAVAEAPVAVTTDVCLPGTQRYLSVELDGGVLTVAYLPPGTAVSLAPGMISAPTASGGTVIVPERYPQLLDHLAPRL